MHKNIEKVLRGMQIFGVGYFIFDSLLHFSNIKLLSAIGIWPQSAISYAQLINYIYGSFVILAAVFLFIIQKDLKKYQTLVIFSSFWALFHGAILIFLVWSQNFQEIFKKLPSILVFLPFYREYLTFNALLLFAYASLVYIWMRKDL